MALGGHAHYPPRIIAAAKGTVRVVVPELPVQGPGKEYF